MTQILKGNIVAAPELGRLDITEHGYLTAEEGNTMAVRMVLTGLLAGIAPERLKERLRESYV